MSARNTAREAIATVALGLGDIREEVVFVGGAAASLFEEYEGADVRATADVDCVVAIDSVVEYHRLALRLRAHGFKDCQDEGAPRCRWVFAGLRVDVMPTANAEAALAALEARAGRVDVLLTDLQLPSLNGRELARKVLLFSPTVKVVLMTGIGELCASSAAEPTDAPLHKPFAPATLARRLRELLD